MVGERERHDCIAAACCVFGDWPQRTVAFKKPEIEAGICVIARSSVTALRSRSSCKVIDSSDWLRPSSRLAFFFGACHNVWLVDR